MKREVPTVADYMSPGALVVASQEKVARARSLMREYGVRHLLILRDGKLAGLVSDRDLADVRSVRAGGPFVDEAMTGQPYVVPPQALLPEVARAMAKRKYGSAVVMDHKGVVGVFTTTDALEALADVLEGKVAKRSTDRVSTKGSAKRGTPANGDSRRRATRRAA
jgi:CBS domain-containing protein